MSPRLKLRAAATPLVLAGALWAGSPATIAAPPVHAEDALLGQRRSAPVKAAVRTASAQTAASAVAGGKPAAVAVHGPVLHEAPAMPLPRQTPPPCSPDGVCIPNPGRFGWYQTRWRTFPGDVPTGLPTEAARPTPEPGAEPGLGGPQLPTVEQEGSILPPREPETESEAAEPGAEGALQPMPEGAAPLPEEGGPLGPAPAVEPPADSPLPGLDSPPSEQPLPLEQPAPLGPATPSEPPGGPAPDPFGAPPADPFGGGPPSPPAWMSRLDALHGVDLQPPAMPQQSAAASDSTLNESAAATPGVEPAVGVAPPAGEIVQPAGVAVPALDGPNLHGEDAPPALPAGLTSFSSWSPPAGAATMGHALAAPSQFDAAAPVIIADDGVVTASAEQALAVELVNPAEAVVIEPDDSHLQQAIYIEASDQEN